MLIINNGKFKFTEFKVAVNTLEKEFGFEGEAWEATIASNDMYALLIFLLNDGVDADIRFPLDLPE